MKKILCMSALLLALAGCGGMAGPGGYGSGFEPGFEFGGYGGMDGGYGGMDDGGFGGMDDD